MANEVYHGRRYAVAVAAATVGAWCLLRWLRARARAVREAEEHAARGKAVAAAVHAAAEDPWMRVGALELAAGLRQRQVRCVDIVEKFIAQIERVNPYINAAVATRFDDARAEAARADEVLDARLTDATPCEEALPPLFGVPFISKEVFEHPGLSYTGGIVGRRGIVGTRLCPALRRVKEAGAILLACGNVSEGCMWAEASNTIYGVTANPYDTSRTCGGSSGGNAALVASLCGAFAVTSDVGGSTRIPSAYNGLFGHKPSGGAIPNTRTVPTVRGKVERYCQLGPCTRAARDLMPLLQILSGVLDVDTELADATPEEMALHTQQRVYMKQYQWPCLTTVDLKTIKYYVVRDQPGAEIGLVSARDPDMRRAQEEAVRVLEAAHGVTVRDVAFPAFKRCFDVWAATLQEAQGGHSFAEVISEGKPGGKTVNAFWEVVKYIVGGQRATEHTLPALGLAAVESLTRLTPGRNREMIALGEELKVELNGLLGDDGVLIFPSLPTPAPRHGPLPNLFYSGDYAATGIFNVLELPATAVPMGLGRLGLPVGVQVVGANGMDHLTIAVAGALEATGTAGWRPPRS